MSGATPTDDRTGGATGRLSELLPRWRRMEPVIGVIVIAVGILAGLGMGVDADAGAHFAADLLGSPDEISEEFVALLHRADDIAAAGEGKAADRAAVASSFLESHARDAAREWNGPALIAWRRDLFRDVQRRRAIGRWLPARHGFSRGLADHRVDWVWRMLDHEASPAARDRAVESVLRLAPRGLLSVRHPTRPLALRHALTLARSHLSDELRGVLLDAGLSPAEVLVATADAASLDGPTVLREPERTWWRAEWHNISDELTEIAADATRAAEDRRSATECLLRFADLPPLTPTGERDSDDFIEQTVSSWRELRDVAPDDRLRARALAVATAMRDDGFWQRSSASHLAMLSEWLAVRIGPSRFAADPTSEGDSEVLRDEGVEHFVLGSLRLPFDTADAGLVAALQERVEHGGLQTLLALRLERAGGPATSSAPQAWRTPGEWRRALGMPPLRTRVTVDWLEVGARGLASHTDEGLLVDDRDASFTAAAPWARFRRTGTRTMLGVPGAHRVEWWGTGRSSWDPPPVEIEITAHRSGDGFEGSPGVRGWSHRGESTRGRARARFRPSPARSPRQTPLHAGRS